jgi:hypothetical protein
MATEAQIFANRANAQSSTGPVTAEGKLRCSRNAVTSGLFSKGDFVPLEDRDIYAEFCAALEADLAPEGAIEHILAAEIVHAAWRLRRCSEVEALAHAHDSDPSRTAEQSIERARASAHRIFNRSLHELRRVQTERHLRAKLPSENGESSMLGVASCKEIEEFLKPSAASSEAAFFRELLAIPRGAVSHLRQQETDFAKQTQSEPAPAVQIPRSAPCSCGSGLKYKRCCGKDAPPVLQRAA